MISITGNILLIFSLLASLLSIFFSYRVKLILFSIASLLPPASLLLLIYSFITSDFTLKNVFFNSSTILPNIYKLSACWASHEGSILLWYSLLCIAGYIYIHISIFSIKTKELAIKILSFLQILFCSFIVLTSNPFEPMNFIAKEGLGLNPMLQDIALSIHPPLLYIGLVSYLALFINGFLLLIKPNESTNILQVSKFFSNFALTALTMGIGLGAWWAYRELGWGGYWFFDPVENISLLPWISGIVLHHFLILSIKKRIFLSWTISLSFLSFILTIYGTFIVRSGIISSVHSFAFSPERGLYIFVICIILTISSLAIFCCKRSSVLVNNKQYDISSYFILFGNLIWLISLAILLISLIYPIYCLIVDDINIVIDTNYFTNIYIPIHIPIIILAAIAPSLQKKDYLRQVLIFGLTLIITIIISILFILSIMAKLFCFASIYLIIHSCNHILVKSHYFSRNITTKSYALFFGHFGFGLLALSITLNVSLSQEIEFIGKVGHKVTASNFTIKLNNLKVVDSSNYFRQIAEFSIEHPQNYLTTLKPENRLYKVENTLSQEASIYSYLFNDLYAVLNQINQDKLIHAKIYYQPLISFIWLSVFFISCGFVFAINKKFLVSK